MPCKNITNQSNLDVDQHKPYFDSFFPYSQKQLGFDKPNFKKYPTRGYPSSMTAEQQLAKGYDEVITKGYKKFPDTPKRSFTTKKKI